MSRPIQQGWRWGICSAPGAQPGLPAAPGATDGEQTRRRMGVMASAGGSWSRWVSFIRRHKAAAPGATGCRGAVLALRPGPFSASPEGRLEFFTEAQTLKQRAGWTLS